MDFFELEAFLTLSKTLHFAKTAQRVNLSPSALSRLISRLEDETEQTLLERNNREVKLTFEGEIFAQFAKKCMEEKEDVFSRFKSKSNAIAGILRVYASVTACYSIMPPFLSRLAEQYPDIQLNVETGDPAGAILAVKEGRADIAVAAIPDSPLAEIDCIPVRRTPLVFAASTGGPFEKVSGSPQDIVSSVPLILPKAGIARERFDIWTESRNVKPIIAAETEGNEAIMAMVQLGLGIGLVPHIVLTNGPYETGFTCHSAGNSLGYYEVGFIQKRIFSGSESYKKMRQAVDKILHSPDRSSNHKN
ncbi:HTH-type transcriptional activator IlvY [Treponema pectinovorum]|uniref:HTH-type transcriptional activator IlvY n=2 Tax=Treponema pectinovorum TaxID=164 RepID=UPI0011F11D8B|nr:HTH-type transcriptional activator IlvY [Treponema pectinovorum]